MTKKDEFKLRILAFLVCRKKEYKRHEAENEKQLDNLFKDLKELFK